MIWIVLTVIFAVLKLVGIVAWPWLWVFSPLLVMLALAFLSFLLVALAIAISAFIEEPMHRYLLLPFAAIALVMLVGFGWWIALVPLILLAIYMIYLAVQWTFECI